MEHKRSSCVESFTKDSEYFIEPVLSVLAEFSFVTRLRNSKIVLRVSSVLITKQVVNRTLVQII